MVQATMANFYSYGRFDIDYGCLGQLEVLTPLVPVPSAPGTFSWYLRTPGTYVLLVPTYSWYLHPPGTYVLLVPTSSWFLRPPGTYVLLVPTSSWYLLLAPSPCPFSLYLQHYPVPYFTLSVPYCTLSVPYPLYLTIEETININTFVKINLKWK